MEWLNEIQSNFQMFLENNNVSQSVAAGIASCFLWALFFVWKIGKSVLGTKVMGETADLIMESLKKNEEWRWGTKNNRKTGSSIVFDRGNKKIIANFKDKTYFLVDEEKKETNLTKVLTRSERKALNRQVKAVRSYIEEKEKATKTANKVRSRARINDAIVNMLENKPAKPVDVAAQPEVGAVKNKTA